MHLLGDCDPSLGFITYAPITKGEGNLPSKLGKALSFVKPTGQQASHQHMSPASFLPAFLEG